MAPPAPPLREVFTRAPDGSPVERLTLRNPRGRLARVITWGASLTELHAPDRDGRLADVVLGFDRPEDWVRPQPLFGAVVGRCANRIRGARFTLDGREHRLDANHGPHHIHGGADGFFARNWRVESVASDTVRLALTSPDGDQGYPGRLEISITYTLTARDELRLQYEAATDRPTVLNPTHHAFWNLGASASVLDHELRLAADRFVEVDEGSLPTGRLVPARDAMDFRSWKRIGADLGQLRDAPGAGYDHTFVVDGGRPAQPALAAELRDPSSGRVMRVFTTEPGVQVYTANYLDGVRGKGGRVYGKNAGICLEAQHFPDSPNQPAFPSVVLRPGETFRSVTVHAFPAGQE